MKILIFPIAIALTMTACSALPPEQVKVEQGIVQGTIDRIYI